MDAANNIVIGGSSSDPALIYSASVPNPFVTFLATGGYYRWSKMFNVIYDIVIAVKFNPSATKIAATFDVGPLLIVILDPATGNLLSSYRDSSATGTAGYARSDGLLFDASDRIYIAMSSMTSTW